MNNHNTYSKGISRLSKYALPLLRYGMALVFFYFAIMQLKDPGMWIGYIPEFLAAVIDPKIVVVCNAIFEIVAAVLLVLGVFVRPVSLILGLHLAAITLSVGFNPTGVRDFGLTISMFAIALYGPDSLSLYKKF